jgi:CoA:oxalate CoA-transferase
MTNKVLDGIRVTDMTLGVAGSSATKLLAELGAEVIKIESPAGEFTRNLIPFVFQTFNRGKRSVAVDIKSDDGVALVKRIAASSDVFIQSQKPGLVAGMGLGRDELTSQNPRLIYATFSGYGSTGPASQRRAVDALVQSESGMAMAQGGVLGNLSFIDTASGLSLVTGVLAALLRRATTGEIEHVEACLLNTAVYLQAAPLAEFSMNGTMIDQVAYARRYPLVGTFQAADGPVFFAAYWERDWHEICTLTELQELENDARFATPADRSEHVAELRPLLEAAFATRPRRYWIDGLESRGIMAGEMRNYGEVIEDEQVVLNEALVEGLIDDGARALFAQAPYRLTSDVSTPSPPAPQLGADTVSVLESIGVDRVERERLVASGVIGA